MIRECLKKELKPASIQKELAEFDTRVDQLALAAFDIYMQHSARIYELRVNEVKRNVAQILKRTEFFDSDTEQDPPAETSPDLDSK